MRNPPNNLQMAVAQIAYCLAGIYTKQLYVLPCGSGKSRVMAAVTLLLLHLVPSAKKIHLVYANDILKHKDLVDFEDLY